MLPYHQIGPTSGGVTGTSSSARMSSRVSLLMMGGLPRSETWPVFDAAPLMVFMVLGRWSITSCLSWLRLEAVGGAWQGFSGKDLKTAWCSSSRALNLHILFLVHLPYLLLGTAFMREHLLCPVDLLFLYNLIHIFMLGIQHWTISRTSSAATHWCIRLSLWAQAQQRFRFTLVLMSLRQKDLKTSLQADRLNTSSSDDILITYWLK